MLGSLDVLGGVELPRSASQNVKVPPQDVLEGAFSLAHASLMQTETAQQQAETYMNGLWSIAW